MRAHQPFRYIAVAASLLAGCGLVKVNGNNVGSKPTSSESSSTDSSGSSDAVAGAADGEPHDKLSILELKIGMPMEQAGFVCAKDAGFYNGAECVKFLDRRCNGKGANIGPKHYGDRAPLGCFIEERSVATFLDDALLQQRAEVGWGTEKADPARYPLVNVHTYGTKSKPSKISRIVYTMAMDELASGSKASGSKLYNALVAKYGAPKEIWSGKVRWRAGETSMEAYCDLTLCTLEVEDKKFEENENRRQEEVDAKVRQTNAPTPKL
jgi:hypothetical protein